MELKISGIKALSKSQLLGRSPKSPMNKCLQQPEEMVACARTVSEDGVMRVKLVVKKADLERTLRTLELLRRGSSEKTAKEKDHNRTTNRPSPAVGAEQRLSQLRRKRSMKGYYQWSPALQSIPEEICVF